MRPTAFWPALLLVLSSFVFVIGAAASVQAAEGHNFIIAASEGYGVQDCLGGDGDCGQVVADAWCEAHGHGPALAFGKTDDVTSTVAVSVSQKMPAGAYFVTCGE
jgi:hypothetical protein